MRVEQYTELPSGALHTLPGFAPILKQCLYMSDRYSTPLSDKQARMFKNWSRVDPVSDYECHLNLRKAKLQGWDNPFVSLGCQGEADTGKRCD